MSPFREFLLNNAGDPFHTNPYTIHDSKLIEQKVINFFSVLYGIKNPWGYITTGSTEGNLQGLRIGRDFLKKSFSK
jgi:glutamate/tyrosine decarboxylase-like PLP-dependent enzyme